MLSLLSQGVFAAFRVYMQQKRAKFASFARISISKASKIGFLVKIIIFAYAVEYCMDC